MERQSGFRFNFAWNQKRQRYFYGIEQDFEMILLRFNRIRTNFEKGRNQMPGDRPGDQEAIELMQRALQAKFNGEIEKALALIEQSILFKEEAGLNPAQEKIQRELIRLSPI